MTKNLPRLAVIVVVCQVFAGCATEAKYKTDIADKLSLNTSSLESKPAKGVVLKSGAIQREPDNLPFSAEEKWYSTHGGLPQNCVALSGGGIRSASFSIGILAELSKAGVLDRTDIMSSVSGGGYALSWFYMQHYNAANGGTNVLNKEDRKRIQETMFESPPRLTKNFQSYLRARSRFYQEGNYLFNFVTNIPMIPVHTVANGLFNWHANVGLPSWDYKRRITDVFLKSPNREDIIVPSIYELGQFARQSGLPEFIFNTTAWIGTPDASKLTLHDSVFSFTPLQYGSGAYGMYQYPDDPTTNKKYDDLEALRLNEVIAISGAALDFSSFVDDVPRQFLLSIFALELGRYIANPAVGPGARFFHQILPFPFYLWSRFTPDLTGTGIKLSDGAYSENLAVYPLVVRGCKNIIVVDAEQDPHYEFGSYFLLQKKLREELGLELSVKEIEEGLDIEKIKSKLVKREDHLLGYEKTEETDPSSGARWKKYAANPIMSGAINNFPGGNITLKYIKLAYLPANEINVNEDGYNTEFYNSWLSQECNRVSGDAVADYYYCIKQERVQKPYLPFVGPSDPFPQQPTKDQNFSPEQFNAYVELGRKIGQRLTMK